jgi:hypothetical protein
VLDGSERKKLLETLDVAERVERCLEYLIAQQTLLGDNETMH